MKNYFAFLTAVVAISTMFIGCASTPPISTYGASIDSLVKVVTEVPDGVSTTYYLTIEKSIDGKVVEKSTIRDSAAVAA
ncbi:hypothetical protein AGMMS49942_01550 [Spirochaetia bacterium]|nr:hypothetical protein AGMMS49942_01550 [Spirochaetia bacterium]